MGVNDNVISDLVQAMKTDKPDDNNFVSAVVSKIDDEGVIWVYVAGSTIETPTASTNAEVSKGDAVTVEWRNNKLYILGNSTNPSAGAIRVDAVEIAAGVARTAAENAVADAGIAREAAEDAKTTAESVHGIAVQAQTDAGIAKTAANESLKGLGMTQEVLDVVNWVATHGVYVKATSYIEGTSYYTVVATEVTDPSQQTDELVGRYYEKDGDIYVKTADTTYDEDKTYYNVTGTPVPTPKSEDIGQYYTLNVTDAMGDYINAHLALTNEGLYVMADNSEWKVRIADDGVYIINPNEEIIAKYKDSVTIGKSDGSQSYLYEDYHSLKMINNEGDTYFYVSDLRSNHTAEDEFGEGFYYVATDSFVGDGATKLFNLSYLARRESDIIVKVNNEVVDESAIDVRTQNEIILINAPTNGAPIELIYPTTISDLNAYSFGRRFPNSYLGRSSVAEGDYTEASGDFSHAEGGTTKASGNFSHAEGYATVAEGLSSHAEGQLTVAIAPYSHAEGRETIADSWCSHAEGRGTRASGNYSHAAGYNTIAQRRAQTAIGEYDEVDTGGSDETVRGNYSFIIGNGTSDNARSNALTVDWDGSMSIWNEFVRDTSGATNDGVRLVDNNGDMFAYMRGNFYRDSQNRTVEGFDIGTTREVNGVTKKNNVRMYIDADGNSIVSIQQPAAWRDALGLGVDTTNTISSIISVNSTNATITSASFAQYGKMAQIYIAWTNKNAISVPASGNITNVQVGTLVTGKRPVINSAAWSSGDNAGASWYNIGTGGVITLGACEGTGTARTIAAGTTFNLYTTFILP